jgi:hypothetical protein
MMEDDILWSSFSSFFPKLCMLVNEYDLEAKNKVIGADHGPILYKSQLILSLQST